MLEVVNQGGFGRKVLEVLGKDLAATSSALSMLDAVEEVLDQAVGPRHESYPTPSIFRQGDRVTPEGGLRDVVSATIQRMYYTTSNGEWLPAQSVWYPDYNQIVSDGLTGCTRIFTWDDLWPENYWLASWRQHRFRFKFRRQKDRYTPA